MIDLVRRMTAPVWNRILLMLGRALLTAIDDSDGLQRVQVAGLNGEVRDALPRIQNYGFTSVPLTGAYAIVAFQGGDRDHGAVVAADDPRYRPKGWNPGEVGMYDNLGKFIRLHDDGTLEINAPKIVLNADENIVLRCDDVSLGDEGGAAVARVGDRVDVGGGSSAGLWPIVEGSDKVTAD